ncbi:MAG TPA: hypothetical protein PLA97_19825, partial [Rubrivivax sp.]|nr:hypothetical protein [Rubrivivax sp.]
MSRAIELNARALPGFEGRVAHAVAVLQSAAAEHAGAIVQTTSLGAEDMVVTDLIARHSLPIALATLVAGLRCVDRACTFGTGLDDPGGRPGHRDRGAAPVQSDALRLTRVG